LLNYLANFLTGDSSPESIAKVLVYSRVLATSINTSFGTNMQKFCSEVLSAKGSVVRGIDLEYIDALDGRKKYCQVKVGPQTINKDDIKTITDHFGQIKRLARTNNLPLRHNDLVVGILYGEARELSQNYRRLANEFMVLSGKDFWLHFTGDPEFYNELIRVFAEVAEESDARKVLKKVIKDLARDIREKGNFLGLI